jgi:hypothetical protein
MKPAQHRSFCLLPAHALERFSEMLGGTDAYQKTVAYNSGYLLSNVLEVIVR